MVLKGVFEGLGQATVSGLEDRSEGPGVMKDEEEGNNRRCTGEKGMNIVSIVSATSGHIRCLIPFQSLMFFLL